MRAANQNPFIRLKAVGGAYAQVKAQNRPAVCGTVKDRPENARTHSRKQIARLASVIRTFGFVVPVLVDQDHVLIAGHARVQAAKLVGMSEVPAIFASHLSAEQVRALTLADNRMSELGGFDKVLLAKEMAALVELLPMPEIIATGYAIEEIELLCDVAGSRQSATEENALAAIDRSKRSVTQFGTCWASTSRLPRRLGSSLWPECRPSLGS